MKRMITRSKSLSILFTSFTLLAITLATGLHDVKAEQGPLMRPQTWVDGKLFDGVVTLTDFKPLADAFDELYTMGMRGGFRNGVPLISDAAPTDTDYNGGRWHLNVLRDHIDPEKYATASSVEELDTDDFMSTDMYFECPLLPRRMAGRRYR